MHTNAIINKAYWTVHHTQAFGLHSTVSACLKLYRTVHLLLHHNMHHRLQRLRWPLARDRAHTCLGLLSFCSREILQFDASKLLIQSEED